MLQYIFSRRLLFVLFIITAIDFYAINVVPYSIQRLIEFIFGQLVVFLVVIYTVYGKQGSNITMYFKKDINLILISISLSVVSCYFFHYQSIGLTLFVSRFAYFFLFYFLLHYFNLDREYIFEIVYWIGLIWCIIFLIQYSIFPRLILNSRVELSRGTIRIFIPGYIIPLLAYFYSLHKILTEKYTFKYLLFIFLYFVITGGLSGTRSFLGSLLVLSGLFVLFYKQVKSRVVIVLVAGIVGAGGILLMWNFIAAMIETTNKQMTWNEYNEPVRKQAFRYFLTEFMPHKLCYILGNGSSHPRSYYGQQIISIAEEKGLFIVDIGFMGEYVRHGLLFFIIEIKIIIGLIFRRLPRDISFVRYVYAFLLFINILGAGAMSTSANVLAHAIIFYLVDLSFAKEKENKTALNNV